MTFSNNQYKPGTNFSIPYVRLFVAGGSVIDITQLVQEITISQSIFQSSIEVSILIQDIGTNIIESALLMGQEQIQMQISTSGKLYTINVYIYRIDSRIMEQKKQVYIIRAISLEAIKNEYVRISERVSNIKAEIYIKNALASKIGSIKKFNIDESLFNVNCIIPNWRLFEFITWISSKTSPSNLKNAFGYLFYENLNGYNFRSIDNLIAQNPYFEYTYYQANTNANTNNNSRNRIIRYASPNAFDILKELRNGSYSHSNYYIDLQNRRFTITQSTADDFYSNSINLGQQKPYRTNTDLNLLNNPSRVLYKPNIKNAFDLQSDDPEVIDEINKSVDRATYRYNFMQYNHVDCEIYGDLDIQAGFTINLNFPSPARNTAESVKKDERFSGKYLISTVTHTIKERTSLETKLTCIRDTFGSRAITDTKVMGRPLCDIQNFPSIVGGVR